MNRAPTILFTIVACLVFVPCFAQSPEYDLNVQIDAAAKRMRVHGTMTIPASAQKLDQVHFALSELMTDVRVEILAPVVEKNPKIEKTHRAGSRPSWGQFTYRIVPHTPVPPGDPVVIGFDHQYSADRAGFVLAGSDRSFFASGINSAWYPQVEEYPRTDDGIPLRGVRAVGKIRFQLPDGWDVYSPGKRIAEKDAVKFTIDRPVFFAFAAAKYSVRQMSNPMDVSLFELSPRGERMNVYLSKTASILDVLVKEFGPYPHPAFAIAEVPADQADGAGFAGASLDGFMLATSDFLNQEFNTAYYGHEIGHQWWGNLVRPDGPEARWLLSEAMAQYGSLRSVQSLEEPKKAEMYRRKGYPGYIRDQSGFGYLSLSAAGLDLPLTQLPAQAAVSRTLADSKGFFAFDMLSREVGREKFSNALKTITAKYAGRRISWNAFKAEISKAAGQDMSWFFQQWFDRTGAPDLESSWEQKDQKLRIHVNQKASYFRVNVPVTISGKDQHVSREISIDGATKDVEFEIPFVATDVMMNPNYEILSWTAEYKEEATAIAPFTRASMQHDDGNAEKAREMYEEGLRNLPNPDPHGLTFLMHYGLGVMLFYENKLEESRKHLEAALSAPVLRPERLPWAYLRLAEIADKQNDPKRVCSTLQSVLSSDRSLPEKSGATEHTGELSTKHGCVLSKKGR